MDAFEIDFKNFEMNSLISSAVVKVIIVLDLHVSGHVGC